MRSSELAAISHNSGIKSELGPSYEVLLLVTLILGFIHPNSTCDDTCDGGVSSRLSNYYIALRTATRDVGVRRHILGPS